VLRTTFGSPIRIAESTHRKMRLERSCLKSRPKLSHTHHRHGITHERTRLDVAKSTIISLECAVDDASAEASLMPSFSYHLSLLARRMPRIHRRISFTTRASQLVVALRRDRESSAHLFRGLYGSLAFVACMRACYRDVLYRDVLLITVRLCESLLLSCSVSPTRTSKMIRGRLFVPSIPIPARHLDFLHPTK